MIRRSIDKDGDIIIISADGEITPDDVDLHFLELRRMIDRVRNSGQPVRVLSDLDVHQRRALFGGNSIARRAAGLFREGDRIAIIAADEADKQRIREVVDGSTVTSFVSRLAAEQWLLLDR